MYSNKKELIFITQSINPSKKALGFTIDWINSFQEEFNVTTISQDKSNYINIDLGNYVIGEKGRIQKLTNFLLLILRIYRKKESIAFVHMIPIYALILLLLKKITKINKIYLWFAHKDKPFYFFVLQKYLDGIFTTTSHTFPGDQRNIKYLGHGISSDKFTPNFTKKKLREKIEFIYVGRITPVKNISYILILINQLSKSVNQSISLVMIGSPVTITDYFYAEQISQLALNLDSGFTVKFVGEVLFNNVGSYYGESSIGINASPTGAIDKAPIEGLFAKAPFFYINDAYNDLFEQSIMLKGRMQISGVLKDDVNTITSTINLGDQYFDEACSELIEIARDKYSLKEFFQRLIKEINK